MIKLHGSAYLLPTAGGVAGFTGSLEGSLVWVGMAGGASIEFYSRELHGLVRSRWKVAFVANNLGMKTGQGILRFGVVELLCLLPVIEIVATLAIRAELAFVGISMAGHAVLRERQK